VVPGFPADSHSSFPADSRSSFRPPRLPSQGRAAMLNMSRRRGCRTRWPFESFVALFLSSSVHAVTETRYVDDQYGDSVTGVLPVYGSNWSYGPDCPGCYVERYVGVDTSKIFQGSWHDVTYHTTDSTQPAITVSFTGV
jgi:hypothetical protein